MATNFSNPFAGVGSAMLEGLLPRLGDRRALERERARRVEVMNPVRESLLNQLTGQQPFAGGPASEFPPGTPGVSDSPFAQMLGNQAGQMVPQEPGVAAQPAQTQPTQQTDRTQLPDDLRPPPGIDAALRRAADNHGVPVNALRALAAQESNFRAGVVGGTPIDLPGQEGDRARGLFQFTPAEIAKMPGFDPNDPDQAADETARRLSARLQEGKPIDIAMMEHFGGPDPNLHGPRTRRYRQDVMDKFSRLEASAPGEQGQQGGRRGVLAQGESVGPFGTITQDEPPRLSRAQQMLASVARDPRAFAEQFAGEGGMERVQTLLEGGDTGGAQQTRVISGDTPEGRSMGIQPGERARVAGTVMPGGQFFPQEVKATPFGADAEGGGGPLVTLMDMQSGEVTTRRRDDPEVDRMTRDENFVVASDGRALESLENMSQGEKRELRNAQVGTKTYIASVRDGLEMLNENPDINTFVARGASFINDMRQEAKAFAGAMGTEFDDDVFNVSAHEDTFRELGVEREKMQSLITSLAFQRAVAEKGGTGRITNRDIERFIAEIGGGSSDPVALAQVLQDTANRAARSFRINFETRTGAPFEGSLGLDTLPRFAPRQQFDNGGPEAGGAEAAPGGEGAGLPSISSDADYEQLPSGTEFIAPDGTRRRKP